MEFPSHQQLQETAPITEIVDIRANGLGSFNIFPDPFLAKVFLIPFWFDKAFYQFANHESVWRKIALLLCKGDCFYEHSWKYTTKLVLWKNKQDYLALNFVKYESSSSSEEQPVVEDGKYSLNKTQEFHVSKSSARDDDDDEGGEDEEYRGKVPSSYYHSFETSNPNYREDTSSSDIESNSTRSSSSSRSESSTSVSDDDFDDDSKCFHLGPYPPETDWSIYPASHNFGFPSHYFQHKWTQANYDLLTHFSHQNFAIPRLSQVTEEDFMINYARPGRMAIITDVIRNWPATDRWDPDKLAARFPYGVINIATANLFRQKVRMTWPQYVMYMRRQKDVNPLYVFDAEIGEKYPSLLKDFEIPRCFWQDYFSLLGERFRPPYRWFVMGPKGSGSGFHVDPNGTAAWNALVRGTKRWAFYHPDSIPPGLMNMRFDRRGKLKHFQAPNPLTWYLRVYPTLSERERPIEFLQHAGDLLYIPQGWWHMVLNLNETVSVTQNFVNSANLNYSCVILHNRVEKGFIKFWLSRLKQCDSNAYTLAHDKFQSLQRIVRARKVAVLEEENQELMEKIAELEAQLAKKENAKKNTIKRKNKTKKLLQ